jgi:hypothetical protein
VEKVTDPHARISVIGAITLTPEYHGVNLTFDLSPDNANFNGQSIAAFLRLLHERVKHPITVIWDSVGIHLTELRRTLTTELKRLQRQPQLLHAFIRRTKLSFEE